MTTTTLVLEPPCAFINANDRLHYRPKAKLTRTWRALTATTVNGGWYPDRYQRAHITVTIRFADNIRRDVGNYYPTAKAIVDGLVDAQLLPDDNDAHLTGPDMRRERPNGTPRVTVTIEEISPMPDKPELTPCATNHRLFLSTDLGDHAEAREDCYSCPRIAWCADERAAAAADNGRTSVDGTWAGILWVDGVISDTGKRMHKTHPRPRPVVA